MHDTSIDGEIVRRSDTPMDSAVFDHFKLSDALAIKYRLELGQTGNSLWLRQLGFTVTIEDNGKTTTDGNNYVYGDSFTLPATPAAPEGLNSAAGSMAISCTTQTKRLRLTAATR